MAQASRTALSAWFDLLMVQPRDYLRASAKTSARPVTRSHHRAYRWRTSNSTMEPSADAPRMQQQEGSCSSSNKKEDSTSTSNKIGVIETTLTLNLPREPPVFLEEARTDHPRMFHFFSLPDFPGSALHMQAGQPANWPIFH